MLGLSSTSLLPCSTAFPCLPPALAACVRAAQLPPSQALDLIRAGQHPFELQGIGHLLPRTQALLAGLLAAQHRVFGAALSFSGEGVPRDKQGALAVFSGAVRLVPYLRPEGWPGLRPLDLLPA